LKKYFIEPLGIGPKLPGNNSHRFALQAPFSAHPPISVRIRRLQSRAAKAQAEA
jgi:Zn-dependent protease with chaperone function